MKVLIIFLFLSLIGCQKTLESLPTQPSEPFCLRNFVIKNYQLAGMKECDREALIKDFEGYIAYVKALNEIGELSFEPEIHAIPQSIYLTKNIYCFAHCGAWPYIKGLCHHWEAPHRITRQNDQRRARQEIKKNPICKSRWKDLKADPAGIDYNWKNHSKYKEWKSGQCGDYIPCQ